MASRSRRPTAAATERRLLRRLETTRRGAEGRRTSAAGTTGQRSEPGARGVSTSSIAGTPERLRTTGVGVQPAPCEVVDGGRANSYNINATSAALVRGRPSGTERYATCYSSAAKPRRRKVRFPLNYGEELRRASAARSIRARCGRQAGKAGEMPWLLASRRVDAGLSTERVDKIRRG